MAAEQQMPPPAGARNGVVIDVDDEEYKKCEKHCKYIAGRVASTTLMHPISFARTLMQLGHEPYPIERGRVYYIGREANYLPNILKYLSNVYRSHGFGALYTGIGASIFDIVTNQVGSFAVSMYLDKCYPEVGGAQDLVMVDKGKQQEEEEEDLDAYQALRLKLRESIRKTIVQLSGLLISRPFTVIMVRQIAQHIGNETKYAVFNPIQPLMCIGAEEGPAGFYSGIIPASINVIFLVWGTAALSYGVDRALKYMEKDLDMHDEKSKDAIKSMRKGMDLLIMLGVNNIRYPFEVVSTMMAVTGSGLLVSLFPYSPVYSHWSDVYDCLKPFELYRGAKIFWREQKSPIRIGPDHKTYASKKHFI